MLPRLLLDTKYCQKGPKQHNKLFFCSKGKKSLGRRPKPSSGARSRPAQRAVSSSLTKRRIILLLGNNWICDKLKDYCYVQAYSILYLIPYIMWNGIYHVQISSNWFVTRGFGRAKTTNGHGMSTAARQQQHMDNATTPPQFPRRHQSYSDYQSINTPCYNKTQCSDTTQYRPLSYVSFYHVP